MSFNQQSSSPPSPGGTPQAFAMIRLVWMAHIGAAVIISGVGAFVVEPGDDTNETLTVIVTALMGLSLLGLTHLAGQRRLDCSTDSKLIQSWTARSFMTLSLAELPALLGFVWAIVGETHLPLAIGLAISIVALLANRPSSEALDKENERLISQGCGRSLSHVLGSDNPLS